MMERYSNSSPNRIAYWIKENIHMVWDAVNKLQVLKLEGFCLRISFYEGSYPIVMQWHTLSSKETENGNDFISEDLWYINKRFSSIYQFATWVDTHLCD